MAEPRPPIAFTPALAVRLQKALTAGREKLFHWVREPSQAVLRTLLKNRRTPMLWFTLFLPSLHRSDLKALLLSRQLTSRQKSLVKKALEGHVP